MIFTNFLSVNDVEFQKRCMHFLILLTDILIVKTYIVYSAATRFCEAQVQTIIYGPFKYMITII